MPLVRSVGVGVVDVEATHLVVLQNVVAAHDVEIGAGSQQRFDNLVFALFGCAAQRVFAAPTSMASRELLVTNEVGMEP